MDTNIEENHNLIYMFYTLVGEYIYISKPNGTINDEWIANADGQFFDQYGFVRNPKVGRRLDDAELKFHVTNQPSPNTIRKFKEMERLYFKYHDDRIRRMFKEMQDRIGYTEIENIGRKSLTGRAYKIKLNGKTKFLRLISPFDGAGDPIKIIKIYQDLSNVGITPHLNLFGYIDSDNEKYGYIVTDYYPLTLKDIKGPELKLAEDKAIELSYKMESMGYYNIDSHAGNFLYDPDTKKVYAIDFADVTVGRGPAFEGIIYGLK